jgi:predicted lactoylglutathione lyase
MYESVDDLDGYHWSPFWMKPDAETGATASV